MAQVLKDRQNIKVYRFKFSDEIISLLRQFAKLHQFDDRISFKEAWGLWLKLYNEEIAVEHDRLVKLGYVGDIENKLFKSTRYYFRKKLGVQRGVEYSAQIEERVESEEGEEVIKSVERKKTYISLDVGILEVIDLHIKETGVNHCSPAEAWNHFCETNKIIVAVEITRIMREADVTKDIAFSKVKKAYKNKNFQYIHNLSKI